MVAAAGPAERKQRFPNFVIFPVNFTVGYLRLFLDKCVHFNGYFRL